MELGEPIGMQYDDVLMGTDAGFYGFMESIMPSGAAPPAAALEEASMHVEAGLNGTVAALPAHHNSIPDRWQFAPRPPDSQAQPPLLTFQWPSLEVGSACLRHESSSSGNSMGGTAGEGAGAFTSEGAAAQPRAQPRAQRRRGYGGSGDEDARHPGILIHKAEAERDKNRVAQKAFRARKKEREAANEAQLRELSARLAALELEKRALLARNVALERAVAASTLPAPGAAPGSPSSAVPPASPHAQDKGGRVIRPSPSWDSNLDWGPGDTLELTLGEPGTAVRLDQALLAQTALPDVPSIWKRFVNKLAALLPEAGKQPDGPAAAMVKLLIAELTSLIGFRARVAPGSLKAFITRRMEDVPFAPEAPSRGMWKRIMESMALSAEQKASLLAVRRAMLARFGELLHERRAVQARLRTSTLALLDGGGYEPMNGRMVGSYCELREDSQLLEANIEALHRSKCTFFCRVWRQILQPLQSASLVVQAYPFLPDMLAVLGILAEEEGEQPIGQLMAVNTTALHPVREEGGAPPAPFVVHEAPVLVPAS